MAPAAVVLAAARLRRLQRSLNNGQGKPQLGRSVPSLRGPTTGALRLLSPPAQGGRPRASERQGRRPESAERSSEAETPAGEGRKHV